MKALIAGRAVVEVNMVSCQKRNLLFVEFVGNVEKFVLEIKERKLRLNGSCCRKGDRDILNCFLLFDVSKSYMFKDFVNQTFGKYGFQFPPNGSG